jgi:cytochrome c oxidase cbb3-type subunit 3
MSSFWNGWIVVLTVANVIGALALLYATSKSRQKDEPEAGDTTGHTWDGDLKEYNNPLPRWWLYLFYGTVVFAVGYVVLYPALGSWQGSLAWTQAGQWEQQKQAADAKYAPQFERFAKMDVVALKDDPDAMRVAKNLFANNCAMCHGSDARGAKGFPNLRATNLMYGRTPESVVQTISQGRIAMMPAWAEALGDQGVDEVAQYVLKVSGREFDAALAGAGEQKFQMFCAACHGPDAKGNKTLGAPNLTDDTWLYGGSLATIKETIRAGRNNRMPAHQDLLGEAKVKVLAAYVLGLGPIDAPAPAAAAAADTASADGATPAADAAAPTANAPGA